MSASRTPSSPLTFAAAALMRARAAMCARSIALPGDREVLDRPLGLRPPHGVGRDPTSPIVSCSTRTRLAHRCGCGSPRPRPPDDGWDEVRSLPGARGRRGCGRSRRDQLVDDDAAMRGTYGASWTRPSPSLFIAPRRLRRWRGRRPAATLDEALVEVTIVVRRRPPERLPRLVGMPVAGAVEMRDALPEEAIGRSSVEGGEAPARQLGRGGWRRGGLVGHRRPRS